MDRQNQINIITQMGMIFIVMDASAISMVVKKMNKLTTQIRKHIDDWMKIYRIEPCDPV